MEHDNFTIGIRDFRSLEEVSWSPDGVCLLGGANGSGKTTLLNALKLLQAWFSHGHERGLAQVNSVNLRRYGAEENAPVCFEVQVGEVRWILELPVDGRGLKGTYGERLIHRGQVVLKAAMYQDVWFHGSTQFSHDDDRCCAKRVWDRQSPKWLESLVNYLHNVRVYGIYDLEKVRDPGITHYDNSFLHPSGHNLWQVLHNWQGAPKLHRDRFRWVQDAMRDAFPKLVGDIEFQMVPGQSIGVIFGPGVSNAKKATPGFLAADGVLAGLLHLTAAAGAPDGSLVAIDEVENHLHPHAIRSLLASVRKIAERRDLTIVLASHSPVVMNEFKGDEQRFFIFEPEHKNPQPVPLSEAHDPDWLAHFALGDLFERAEFASQVAREG